MAAMAIAKQRKSLTLITDIPPEKYSLDIRVELAWHWAYAVGMRTHVPAGCDDSAVSREISSAA
jgi:hypothetical protein